MVERMNCTIVEKIKNMLSQANLLKFLWGEGMNTTIHLINLSSLVPLHGDVIQRVWMKKDVSYEYLECSVVRRS